LEGKRGREEKKEGEVVLLCRSREKGQREKRSKKGWFSD
jgi:hypothetical protein